MPQGLDTKMRESVLTTINEEELNNVYAYWIKQWNEQAADPQAENAKALKEALEGKEEAERIQKASEQLLVEGASQEEVDAERQAALEAQVALQQQQDRERIDKEYAKLSKNVRDFLSPVSVVGYMKDLTIKRQGKGNLLSQSAVLNILDSIKQINAFSIPYLQQNEQYSFKQKDLKSHPQVKKLYILSFLLKRVAKIKQLSKETRNEIKTATENFDTMFSSGMIDFLRAVEESVKTTNPKYAGFIQRIKDLNIIVG